MKILRANLILALQFAIEEMSDYERSKGFTMDSGTVAGWKQALEALRRGEQLTIE